MKTFAWLLLAAALGGCTTIRETQPPEAATEQLLISHAAEITAAKLALGLRPGLKVFVDDTHFKGDVSDYAISAIRASLLKQGLILEPDKASSDVTVELRLGGLSIDQSDTVLGIPAATVPIPGTLAAVPIPEISAYSVASRTGKAEFAAFAYDTRTGRALAFVGPVGGERLLRKRRLLMLFSSGSTQETPGEVDGPPPRRR